MAPRIERYKTDPVAFIDDCLPLNERGQRWALLLHQRTLLGRAFVFDAAGRLPYETVVIACPKKSGKTALNAALVVWWAFTQEAPNELLIIANDFEQAQARVFKAVVGFIKHNPLLAQSAEITTRQVTLSNGTTIVAIASEYAGAAGSNHGLTSWDELWGYTAESSRRLWEELTPVPTRQNSIRLITTYAGFEGETQLLWDLYLDGVSSEEHPEGRGERLDPDLPLCANVSARMLVYWDHVPRMPWQTPHYYATQRHTLRPNTYVRLHENRWTTAESIFVTPELWDGCVDAAHHPLPASSRRLVALGVDLGIKHDNAAIVAVGWDDDGRMLLIRHRIWTPSPGAPLDLAAVEDYLRALVSQFLVVRIVVDPYQAHGLIQRLAAEGAPIEEFPQTVPNLTRMGQTLFDALTQRALVLYPDAELRQQAMSTIAIESPRGFRIAKEKASKKIDAVVALAMACVALAEAPRAVIDVDPTEDEVAVLRSFARGFGAPSHPEAIFDDDLGMSMDDPRYPQWH